MPYKITHSSILNTERANNWHCTIKSEKETDFRITVDLWGHHAKRIQLEDIALKIVEVLDEKEK